MNARRLLVSSALVFLARAAAATAQTVIVTAAPPNSSLEVVLNGNVLGAPMAGADGSATVVASGANALTGDIDAFVFVDTCGERRRVVIAQRERADVPADAGCTRQQVSGLFLVRPVSTVVVRVSPSGPTLVLRHGPYNPATPQKARVAAPTGFVLFGGAGLTVVSDAPALACGNVGDCSGDGSAIAYSGGVAYWFTPYLAAEGTYLRPGDATAAGSGTSYQFDSSFETDVFTAAGVFGIPAGAARVFGKGGATYHQALYSTTQTNEDTTITVGDETQTIPGGTQTLQFKTQGWGWFFGGGVEVWISRRFAIYGDVGWVTVKGDDPGESQTATDDSMLYALGGLRFRFGK